VRGFPASTALAARDPTPTLRFQGEGEDMAARKTWPRNGSQRTGIGEIAGAEHATSGGSLEPRQPALQRVIERMVSGDEPRRAGADAILRDGGPGGFGECGMIAEPEIVVARKRHQAPPVALDHDVAARGGHQRPAQVAGLEAGKLRRREVVEG
jgi:hypothetical protein